MGPPRAGISEYGENVIATPLLRQSLSFRSRNWFFATERANMSGNVEQGPETVGGAPRDLNRSVERREALRRFGVYAAVTAPAMTVLLASRQGHAGGFSRNGNANRGGNSGLGGRGGRGGGGHGGGGGGGGGGWVGGGGGGGAGGGGGGGGFSL